MSKTKNYYFKHYNNASDGESLRSLIDERDWQTHSAFWLILELVSRWEKYDRRGFIQISERTLCRHLNTNMRGATTCLIKLSTMFGWSFDHVSTKFVSILVPNFAEYQGSRFKKWDRSKIEIEIKDKDWDQRASGDGNKLPFEKEKIHDLLDQTKTGRQEMSKAMKAWKLKTGI